MSYYGQLEFSFVLSTIYFGVRKGENNYYETDKYDGNGTVTKGIVIFGATGDLCKKKLIPALYKLWEKKLLPSSFVITGAARRDPGRDTWVKSLANILKILLIFSIMFLVI